ncbi:MAG TPA: hypothetical protein VIT23_03220 [Terrimicrobiaceae bacterium]
MKTRRALHLLLLCLGFSFALVLSAVAATFNGEVSDLDAGNGYLSVTNKAAESTQTFKVTSETVILGADGKPSQLLNLIEGTAVAIDVEPGAGKVAAKIVVLSTLSKEPP